MKPLPTNERLLDLLAQQATCGLSQAETFELESLKSREPDADFEVFERAAAAADLATLSSVDVIPTLISDRLKASVPDNFSTTLSAPISSRKPNRLGLYTAWLAAAACLTLAVIAWWPNKHEGKSALTPATVAQFGSSNRDVSRSPVRDFNALDTNAPPEIRGVTGEVVWSDTAQKGYLRLTGMPVNDPSKEQYQLWIIDGTRGLGQRISGAVFDVPKEIAAAKGEVIVEIDPKLHVNKAAIFAVTIEKAGGVWVSDMTRRAVIAKVPGT